MFSIKRNGIQIKFKRPIAIECKNPVDTVLANHGMRVCNTNQSAKRRTVCINLCVVFEYRRNKIMQQMHSVCNSMTGYMITSNNFSYNFNFKRMSVLLFMDYVLKLPATAGKKLPVFFCLLLTVC